MEAEDISGIREAVARLEDARDRLAGNPLTPDTVLDNLTSVVASLVLACEESMTCYRCQRVRPTTDLEPTTDGQFKCSPGGPAYDDCMRIFNTV